MRRARRGATLVEAMVAAAVLALLMTALFACYRMGASAWKKTEAQHGLLQQLQIVQMYLAREVEGSPLASVVLDGTTAVSFMTARDENGVVQLDPGTALPLWRRYVVFYYDAPAREIRLVELPVGAGEPEASNPEPIEQWNAGGSQPLAAYRTGGRVLAQDIANCSFTLVNNLLEVDIQGARKRYGSEELETLRVRQVLGFLN